MAEGTAQPPAQPVISVGLLGLGVVGAGVYQALLDGVDTYAQRSGALIEVRRVAVRDPSRARAVSVPPADLDSDPLAVAGAARQGPRDRRR